MNQKKNLEALSRFLPVESVDIVKELALAHRFQLTFRNGRATRLGDFRPSLNGRRHQITINSDLNIYACLLIFLHEYAHLLVFEQYGRTRLPHGQHWKNIFGQLIRDFSNRGLFHHTLKDSLIRYSYKVRASGIADEQLIKELQAFNQDDDALVLLVDLPGQSSFTTVTGRAFRKGEQLRKRFKCFCYENKKVYLFHPMARVRAMDEGIKQ